MTEEGNKQKILLSFELVCLYYCEHSVQLFTLCLYYCEHSVQLFTVCLYYCEHSVQLFTVPFRDFGFVIRIKV